MYIYYILIFVLFFLGVLSNFSGATDKRKFYLWISFTCLFFIMGLRAPSVGTDNLNYSLQFLIMGKSKDFLNIIPSAPVYTIYNKLLFMIFPFRQAIIILNSLIICVCTALFIYHFSDNVVFSTFCYVALYFYFSSFNITRQYVAVSIILVAACAVDDKKIYWAIVLCALATGIHNLAIVFCPFLFLLKSKINKTTILTIGLGCIIFAIVFSSLFDPVVNMFAKVFPRYSMYLEGGRHRVTDTSQGRNILLTLFYFAFIIFDFFYILVKPSKTTENYEHMKKILMISLIGATLGLVAANNLAISRVRTFFEIFMICLIPNTIKLFGRYKNIFYILCVLILMVPLTVRLSDNLSGVVPYKFFWQ